MANLYCRYLITLAVWLLTCCLAHNAVAADQTLLSITEDFDVKSLDARDTKLQVTTVNQKHVLRVATGHADNWPGFTLKPQQGEWDLPSACYVEMDVRNVSSSPVTVGLRADSAATTGKQNTIQITTQLPAGARRTMQLDLLRKMPASVQGKLFGMRGYPAHFAKDKGIDPRHVEQIIVFVNKPNQDHVIEIEQIRSSGECDDTCWYTEPVEKLFPMIDQFGQYIHKDWPGKVESESDLASRKRDEAAELVAHPGPGQWDRFGGWADGPKLTATGSFRVQQYHGKWWLVDPDGRLFWSHGIDCVNANNATTPITDRRFLFADLPAVDSPFGVFYGHMGRAPHGYYAKDGTFETYNFTAANLYRKYGSEWKPVFNDLCHRRLRSWGLNTIANWSDRDVYCMQRTPYVVTLGSGRRPIEGSTGYWGKFPDPFDPSFAATAHANARRSKADMQSPWCLGVFVDNELAWGGELSLATATFASPATQAAKIAAITFLKKKYNDIGALNAAWGTKHASWDALLASQDPPSETKARADLAAVYTEIAEQYFRVCRDAVKQVVPDKLYLGCRFAWVNDRAVRTAAKYCDVIGFNKYVDSVADFDLPQGVDAPAIIGEFHFGALDRGMFHTGLRATRNQQDRAATYKSYVFGAVRNRYLVGTHWFQFGDQATTGRFDGENYQIGFLDVCDTPYREIVTASREVGTQMYRVRIDSKSD